MFEALIEPMLDRTECVRGDGNKVEFTPTKVIITFNSGESSVTQVYMKDLVLLKTHDYISKIEVTKGKVTINSQSRCVDMPK